jgi:glucose/arabinose dehydrogenase
VYAYGLRNPFRFGLDASGEPCIGDVGSNRFEEIDRGRGANFGWPCWEGMSPNWHQVEILGAANCAKLDSTAAVTTKPVFAYGREFGNSVIGGDFNRGTAFPEAMRGDFFFGDYATGKLWRLRLDSAGHALGAEVFAEEMGGPVCLRFGPDGCLYYVAYSAQGTSVIRRIGYAGTTRVGTHAAGRGRDGLRDPLAPLYDGIGRIRGRKDASRKVPIPPPGRSGTPVFPGK